MAKLRKVLKFEVGKPDAVKAALAAVEKFCGSGVPEGECELVLHFDAPSLETTRGPKKGDEDEAPAKTPTAAARGAGVVGKP